MPKAKFWNKRSLLCEDLITGELILCDTDTKDCPCGIKHHVTDESPCPHFCTPTEECQKKIKYRKSKAQWDELKKLNENISSINSRYGKLYTFGSYGMALNCAEPFCKNGRLEIPMPFTNIKDDYIYMSQNVKNSIYTIVIPPSIDYSTNNFFDTYFSCIGAYELIISEGTEHFDLKFLNDFYELVKVYLPKSLTKITGQDKWNVRYFCTFCVHKGSYAEAFVKENSLTHELVNGAPL